MISAYGVSCRARGRRACIGHASTVATGPSGPDSPHPVGSHDDRQLGPPPVSLVSGEDGSAFEQSVRQATREALEPLRDRRRSHSRQTRRPRPCPRATIADHRRVDQRRSGPAPSASRCCASARKRSTSREHFAVLVRPPAPGRPGAPGPAPRSDRPAGRPSAPPRRRRPITRSRPARARPQAAGARRRAEVEQLLPATTRASCPPAIAARLLGRHPHGPRAAQHQERRKARAAVGHVARRTGSGRAGSWRTASACP